MRRQNNSKEINRLALLAAISPRRSWISSLAQWDEELVTYVHRCIFAHAGRGDWDFTINCWNTRGKITKTMQGHKEGILCLLVVNDLLFSGSADHTIRCWNKEGVCVKEITGHMKNVIALTTDNKRLISGSEDGL
jgi:WD40 repeat protein